jgi:hypothetical protein
MWERASYRVMRREGSRRSSSFEASTRLARRRRVWPIATVPCSRVVMMASAKRLATRIFYPVGSKSTRLPSVADFITKRDRISRSHASTNVSIPNISVSPRLRPPIFAASEWPNLCSYVVLSPSSHKTRDQSVGFLQTNDVRNGICYLLGPSPRIPVAGFKVRGSA